jgi:conserved oligomeric Golgi complex subunit 3
VRPLVIHELSIDLMCQLINILETEILEQQVQPRGEAVEPFIPVIQRIIQDIQERLTYRAQLYVRDYIKQYSPNEHDLDFPNRLQPSDTDAKTAASASPSPSSSSSSSSSSAAINGNSAMKSKAKDPYAAWYRTLERTLLLLSKLYRCIELPVFEYVAQESVAVCIESLHTASARICTKSSLPDGQLFLVKQLLVLREQISPFEVDFATNSVELDIQFSKLVGVLPGIFRAEWRGFWEMLRANEPKLVDHRIDSKKDLERHLKLACETFINSQTSDLVGPIIEFLQQQAPEMVNEPDAQNPDQEDGAVQPTVALGEAALKVRVVDLLRPLASMDGKQNDTSLKTRLAATRQQMTMYLANSVTEKILFKPIRQNLIETVEKLRLFCQRKFVQPDETAVAMMDGLDSYMYSIL